MKLISKLYGIFKEPSSFEKDHYSWLTNQIGHISFSFTICYLFNIWIPILLFWIFWEIKHLIESKDWKDFFEDLFFELSGVFIFIYGDLPLILSIVILILLLCIRVNKN